MRRKITRIEEVSNAIALFSARENSQPYFKIVRKDFSEIVYSGSLDSYKDYNSNLITINRGIAIDLSIVSSISNNELETSIGTLKVARERLKLIKYKLEQLWKS